MYTLRFYWRFWPRGTLNKEIRDTLEGIVDVKQMEPPFRVPGKLLSSISEEAIQGKYLVRMVVDSPDAP